MAMPLNFLKFTLWIQSPQRPKFFNVFYFIPDLPPTGTGDNFADATTLTNAAYTQLKQNLGGVLTVADNEIGGVGEAHFGGLVFSVAAPVAAIAGTVSSDQEPDFVAVVIQKRTAASGKSGRGRWFLGPVPELLTDENKITDLSLVAYNSVKVDWATFFPSLGVNWQPALHSHKLNSLTLITTVHVNSALGVIRGRKFRPGL